LNSNLVTARNLEEKVSDLERVERVRATAPPPAPAPAPAPTPVAVVSAPANPDRQAPPAAVAPAPPEEEATWYIIRTGDTLSRVASTHNISLDSLTAANPDVNPLRLQIGQKLRIPSP
jgi:LysM repeat protein